VEKLIALFDVFRKGREVSNVEQWKQGTINAGAVAAALSALFGLLRAYGVSVPLDDAQIANLGVGIVAIGGVLVSLLTAATSARAGILPARDGALQRVGEAGELSPTGNNAPGADVARSVSENVSDVGQRGAVAHGEPEQPDSKPLG
jgi:sugar (pentulose or hexulose) kinase